MKNLRIAELALALVLVALAAIVGCRFGPLEPAARQMIGAVENAVGMTAEKPAYGTIQLNIRWPMAPGKDTRGFHTQLIPDSSARLDVAIRNSGSQLVATSSVIREEGQATASATLTVRAGNNYSAEITAYPAGASSGTAIAQGAASGINVYSSHNTPQAITMASLYVPSVTSLSVNVGQVGDVITLTGTNFKEVWAADPKVYFNGTLATNLLSASNTSVQVQVPVGATVGNVVVSADGANSVSTAIFFVASGVTIGVTTPQINGHTVPTGMVYYGGTLAFDSTASFTLASGETLTASYSTPPSITWAVPSQHSIVASGSPTVGDTTVLLQGALTAAGSNASRNVTATLGSLTSSAISVQSVGVDSVVLSPLDPTINAMPPSGQEASDSFTTSVVMTATVNSSLPFNDGVTWNLADGTTELISTGSISTTSVTVTTPQTVSGVASGSGSVTATSNTDGTRIATISIIVTDYGSMTTTVE